MIDFPQKSLIIDKFGRKFNYLRISVIENCNLRCVYCMPEKGIDFQPKANLLKREEIIRIINIAARMGITKIRYTGGEPLLRKDIVEIISTSYGIGDESFAYSMYNATHIYFRISNVLCYIASGDNSLAVDFAELVEERINASL